jgi:hypothetical protein
MLAELVRLARERVVILQAASTLNLSAVAKHTPRAISFGVRHTSPLRRHELRVIQNRKYVRWRILSYSEASSREASSDSQGLRHGRVILPEGNLQIRQKLGSEAWD